MSPSPASRRAIWPKGISVIWAPSPRERTRNPDISLSIWGLQGLQGVFPPSLLKKQTVKCRFGRDSGRLTGWAPPPVPQTPLSVTPLSLHMISKTRDLRGRSDEDATSPLAGRSHSRRRDGARGARQPISCGHGLFRDVWNASIRGPDLEISFCHAKRSAETTRSSSALWKV